MVLGFSTLFSTDKNWAQPEQLGSLRGWLARLKIKHKISLGYGVAIAIAVGGSLLGNELGDYYLWQALQRQNHIQAESQLLYQLQHGILYLQVQQQVALTLIDQPTQLVAQLRKIQAETENIQIAWASLERLATSPKHTLADVEHTFYVEQLADFLTVHHGLLELSLTQIAETIDQVTTTPLAEMYDTPVQSLNLYNLKGPSEELRQLIRLSDIDYKRARQDYDRADGIRLQIFIASVALSVFCAVLMALLTSRAIATPLQAANAIAQTVTKESDFLQRLPVLSLDETGQLATSVNPLSSYEPATDRKK